MPWFLFGLSSVNSQYLCRRSPVMLHSAALVWRFSKLVIGWILKSVPPLKYEILFADWSANKLLISINGSFNWTSFVWNQTQDCRLAKSFTFWFVKFVKESLRLFDWVWLILLWNRRWLNVQCNWWEKKMDLVRCLTMLPTQICFQYAKHARLSVIV